MTKDELREALILVISFAPSGPVPKGLFPTSYITLNYEKDVQLQDRIDSIRRKLLEDITDDL